MRKIDREALKRALRIAKAENKQQITAKLKTEPWEEVARFASYCCQVDALNLKPWQSPPMYMEDDKPRDESPVAGRVAAWALRRKLLAAGLSVFEPDPVRALENIAAGQRGDAPPVIAEPSSANRSKLQSASSWRDPDSLRMLVKFADQIERRLNTKLNSS